MMQSTPRRMSQTTKRSLLKSNAEEYRLRTRVACYVVDTNDINVKEDVEIFDVNKIILNTKYDKITAKKCAKQQHYLTPEQREQFKKAAFSQSALSKPKRSAIQYETISSWECTPFSQELLRTTPFLHLTVYVHYCKQAGPFLM